MRFTDLLWLALSALWQRPTRTLLTTLGVMVGTFVLVATLAIGQGVQTLIFDQLRKQDQLRRIHVWQSGGVREQDIPQAELEVPGTMSEERRARLREAIARRWRRPPAVSQPAGVTGDHVAALQAMPHVESVTPNLSWAGKLSLGGKEQEGSIVTASPADRGLPARVVAGRYFHKGEASGVVVSEFLAYRWGMKDEADVASLLGKTARLEVSRPKFPPALLLMALLDVGGQELTAEQRAALDRAAARLPEALAKTDLSSRDRKVLVEVMTGKRHRPLIVEEQPIVGVFRDVSRYEQGPWDGPIRGVDVLVPPGVAERMFSTQTGKQAAGLPSVTVRVEDEARLKVTHERVTQSGLEAFSLAEVVDQVKVNVLLISVGCTLVALVALAVAGLGITNTMLMSVLQRTHEIGVMKAVGARDGQVLLMFLLEGALVGVLGAGFGLLAAWLASFPGDHLARHLIEKQTPMRLEGSVFEYPWWLLVPVPLGVVLWTTLAAVSPARRAARIDPIEALRSR